VRLICIDPGKRIGYALCDNGLIVVCGTVSDRADLPHADIAIIEMPRVYPTASKWKGDPQIIVRLGLLAGEIGTQYPERAYVEPRTWRGMCPEHVLLARITRALTPADCTIGRSVHSRDAQGIALWLRGTLHANRVL
jgi:hypothetical protein